MIRIARIAAQFTAIRRRRRIMQRKDFHGSRAYASDVTDKGRWRFQSRASLFTAWIKLQLGRLKPDTSTIVLRGSSRPRGDGFSLLGLDRRHVQLRELDTDVFPMAHRRRDAARSHGQVKAGE
jgi:hypothetical protein